MTAAIRLKRLAWATLSALVAVAAPASADVSIGRADIDGTELNRSFIDVAGTGTPGDVAVSDGHIYWVAGDSIGRSDLDGLNVDPDLITNLTSVKGLTANGGYLFWGGASIGRARLDGTDVRPNFMTPGADDVAASERYLYWTSDVGIGRANLDGTGADPKFIDAGVTATTTSPMGVHPPTQLAIDGTRAFWVYVN